LTTHQNVAIDTILQNIVCKNNKKLKGLEGPLGEDGGAYGNCFFGGPQGVTKSWAITQHLRTCIIHGQFIFCIFGGK